MSRSSFRRVLSIEGEIASIERLCRPANLPAACPGRDHLVLEKNGFRLAVLTVLGRSFLGMKGECPFLCADALLRKTVGAGAADALGGIHIAVNTAGGGTVGRGRR